VTVLGIAGRVIGCLAAISVAAWTLLSAIRTVVLPRADQVPLTSFVFVNVRRFFNVFVRRMERYEDRDRAMALYAPMSLLILPVAWLVLILLAFSGLFWALDGGTVRHAVTLSGSSMLTLGFERPPGMFSMVLAFVEAGLGVGLLALLISYLPTMYGAFSRRESAVALLEVRAGRPAWGINMIERYWLIEGFDALEAQWSTWEAWFAELGETHTTAPALVFFRSPDHQRSWITAAGAVLDAASMVSAAVDIERAPLANLCIRSGYVALRGIAGFFQIPHDSDPKPTDPIAIERSEFDAAYDRLASVGVPLKADRDQAWRDFAGWRVNYDTVLLELAALTMAPVAPWSSDRSPPYRRPGIIRNRHRT
jgi:hypothetical protein